MRSITQKKPTGREHELFRELLRKSYTNKDIILGDYTNLARHVDADVIRKCKVRMNTNQTKSVAKYVNRTGEDDEMDHIKSTKIWSELDARDFNLEDNVAQIYFDTYSEGFYGEPYPSNNNGWKCPHCGTVYKTTLKTLPHNCKACGWQTPIGRLSEDGVLRR